MHHRNIELGKIAALKAAKGYLECKKMSMLTAAKIEVALWKNNIYTSYRSPEEIPITDAAYADARMGGELYVRNRE